MTSFYDDDPVCDALAAEYAKVNFKVQATDDELAAFAKDYSFLRKDELALDDDGFLKRPFIRGAFCGWLVKRRAKAEA